MRALILGAAALVAVAAPVSAGDDPLVDPALDAVAAAPGSHTVLLENDAVRVLRVTVAPGATEPIHVHRWPSVMRFEQAQPITYIAYAWTDGKPRESRRIEVDDLAPGSVEWAEPEGPHAILNRGSEPFVALRVELKPAPDGD